MYGGSEIRIEIDYGLEYMSKSLSLEEINLRNAFMNLVEARMAMGRYAFYSGSKNPYPNMYDERNEIIELDVDKVDTSLVEVNDDFSDVKHIKFLIRSLDMIMGKIVSIRMQRSPIPTPKFQLLGMRSIDRAIDHMETSICYLGAQLRRISVENPGKYPETKEDMIKMDPDHRDIPESNLTTDKIMEERSKENNDGD